MIIGSLKSREHVLFSPFTNDIGSIPMMSHNIFEGYDFWVLSQCILTYLSFSLVDVSKIVLLFITIPIKKVYLMDISKCMIILCSYYEINFNAHEPAWLSQFDVGLKIWRSGARICMLALILNSIELSCTRAIAFIGSPMRFIALWTQ
jgi:hypothetical protein